MNRMQNRGLRGFRRAGWGGLLLLLLVASGQASASPEEDWQWEAVLLQPAGDTSIMRHVSPLTQAGVALGTRITFVPAYDAENGHYLRLSLMHEQRDHARRSVPSLSIRPTSTSFSTNATTEADSWSLDYVRSYGAWVWQGQFGGGLGDDGSERARFLSGYGALRWFASGHSRRDAVASGRFRRVDRQSPGWELVVSYQRTHGRQRDNLGQDRMNTSTGKLTLGSGWNLRPNLRLLLSLATTLDLDHLTRTHDRSHEWNGQVHYDF